MMVNDAYGRLVVFLYVLLRDGVPAGTVARCMAKARVSENAQAVLEDEHLAALAKEHAAALLGGDRVADGRHRL